MTIVNPSHLFDQAERLIASTTGAPRQADLRRAVSSAYYGVFHAMMTAAADQFVGVTRRATPEYALAYRRVDHAAIKRLCDDARKPTLPDRYKTVAPTGAFSSDLRAFSTAVVDLQDMRHEADYNPFAVFKASDTRAIIATARTAVARFNGLIGGERLTFLCLLAFQPR